jgi:protein-S-isoprenylcysteine O-methyltransferase Ste14
LVTNRSDQDENQLTTKSPPTARFLIREFLGVVILGVLLFLSAGRIDWGMGWMLVAITFFWVCATAWVLIRINPDLIAERLGPRKGAKTWDMRIMGVVGLTTIARLVIAGLDQRYAWTMDIPNTIQVLGAVVVALGHALMVWATASNAYFSQIVRVQEERAHAVASGGPYRFIRHPAYVGSILSEFLVPIMLGSLWAIIPGAIGATLFILRTALEDKTLREELEGYELYSRQVRYRLIPGIW